MGQMATAQTNENGQKWFQVPFLGSRRMDSAKKQEQVRRPKLSPNPKKEIKTISHQVSNKHARALTNCGQKLPY
jgi:hypothetical protein